MPNAAALGAARNAVPKGRAAPQKIAPSPKGRQPSPKGRQPTPKGRRPAPSPKGQAARPTPKGGSQALQNNFSRFRTQAPPPPTASPVGPRPGGKPVGFDGGSATNRVRR
jgi:hypothetical protein